MRKLTLAGMAVAIALAAAGSASGRTTNAASPVNLVAIASGFSQPVYLTNAGDGSGRIFVVERAGRIEIVQDGKPAATPFLDIRARLRSSGSEQGLLSVAFPPDFAAKRYFYVDYTNKQGVGNVTVSRFSLSAGNPNVADPATEQVLLNVTKPFANHNGGLLQFGPDGYLYIGVGDGGGAGDIDNHAQDPNSNLGKLLRMDTEHGGAPVAQVYALGLRNPWRFSFDAANGDLYIGDVGQELYEEVDYLFAGTPPGTNFGWHVAEGLHCFNAPTCSTAGFVPPVAEYAHNPGGNCAIIGGYVYRGALNPDLNGAYFYSDECSGRLWDMKRDATGGWQSQLMLETGLTPTSFGADEAGELYLLDYGGTIYQLRSTAPPIPRAPLPNRAYAGAVSRS
jgi:glucose/arabinose dehydrogenase